MASFGERVVGAMKADVKTFEEIEQDSTAMGQAVGVILLAGVAALIGNFFRTGLQGGIRALVLAVIGAAVWSLIVTLVGTKLMPEPQTKADFNETFRVVEVLGLPNLFAMTPGLRLEPPFARSGEPVAIEATFRNQGGREALDEPRVPLEELCELFRGQLPR